MKRAKSYDDRLQAVASLVRENAILADVGSDHAYLPITLVKSGRIKFAVASDINQGPIANAKTNIEKSGLSTQIKTICCDGLAPLAQFAPTDIVIAGMGGMLIIEILKAASFICKIGTRLILQPMRDAAQVRAYLAEEGFTIVAEKLCMADGKLYQVIAAEYTGETSVLSRLTCLLGPKLMAKKEDPLFDMHLKKTHSALSVRVSGLARAGRSDDELVKMLAEIEKLQRNEV